MAIILLIERGLESSKGSACGCRVRRCGFSVPVSALELGFLATGAWKLSQRIRRGEKAIEFGCEIRGFALDLNSVRFKIRPVGSKQRKQKGAEVAAQLPKVSLLDSGDFKSRVSVSKYGVMPFK